MTRLVPVVAGLLAIATAHAAEPDAFWTYKTVDGKELQLHVFLPENYGLDPAALFPVMVIYHGGSWAEGEASWHYPDCEYWSRRGMVAASVDYRLSKRDGVEVPLECVKDAKSAIRFLRSKADELQLDANRVVAAGGSAGGQLASALAAITAPETNDDSYDLAISCRPDAVILYNPYFKCAAALSPPEHVVAGLPPTIAFLGDEDPAIPVQGLIDFHDKLKAAGNVSELYIGKGGKHGFCNGRDPRNPFFYWSLELEDQFLVKHGILSGGPLIEIPKGVQVDEVEFDAYD